MSVREVSSFFRCLGNIDISDKIQCSFCSVKGHRVGVCTCESLTYYQWRVNGKVTQVCGRLPGFLVGIYLLSHGMNEGSASWCLMTVEAEDSSQSWYIFQPDLKVIVISY
jgi:hypothetical protein